MKITQADWEAIAGEVRFSERELSYEKDLREYNQYKNEAIRNHQQFVSFETWRKI